MNTTFEQFKQGAKFVREKGKRRLMVQFETMLLMVKQQFNGRLTESPEAILHDLYEKQIKPSEGFFDKLQRDLVQLKATSHNSTPQPSTKPL